MGDSLQILHGKQLREVEILHLMPRGGRRCGSGKIRGPLAKKLLQFSEKNVDKVDTRPKCAGSFQEEWGESEKLLRKVMKGGAQ
jgi:hypothetical protein